jgi:hypothetical protein
MTDSEIADKLAEIRRAEANAIEVADACLRSPLLDDHEDEMENER